MFFRLFSLLLVVSLLALFTGCMEHYRVDPETGQRTKISDSEYKQLKKNDTFIKY